MSATPSPADRVKKLETTAPDKVCTEFGRLLRSPATEKEKQIEYYDALLKSARRQGVVAEDYVAIAKRLPRIGMGWCALGAAVGPADHSNITTNTRGTSYQLIYDARRMYVYLDNGVVTAWQE